MTVSRALSNHPNVQKETRETVLKRARELGYVKNAAAKAMRGDITGIVGLLLPNIVNEFYARFANAMAHACDENSYHLIIHLTNDDPEIEQQALERLREVQAMAVAMVPTPGTSASDVNSFGSMKVIQLIRQTPIKVPSASILINDHDAISNAVVELAKKGHTHIGYIGADTQLSTGRARLSAFMDGIREAGLKSENQLIYTKSPSFKMGQESAKDICTQKKATGLICGGFEISTGALSTLMENKLSPHTDVCFIGYGDPSFFEWLDGGISTVRLPVDRLAHETIELIKPPWEEATASTTREKKFDADLIIRG